MTEARMAELMRQGLIAYVGVDDTHYYITTALQQDVPVKRR